MGRGSKNVPSCSECGHAMWAGGRRSESKKTPGTCISCTYILELASRPEGPWEAYSNRRRRGY